MPQASDHSSNVGEHASEPDHPIKADGTNPNPGHHFRSRGFFEAAVTRRAVRDEIGHHRSAWVSIDPLGLFFGSKIIRTKKRSRPFSRDQI
jgi:hypothetical protein